MFQIRVELDQPVFETVRLGPFKTEKEGQRSLEDLLSEIEYGHRIHGSELFFDAFKECDGTETDWYTGRITKG